MVAPLWGQNGSDGCPGKKGGHDQAEFTCLAQTLLPGMRVNGFVKADHGGAQIAAWRKLAIW